jgi:hypothetical protein
MEGDDPENPLNYSNIVITRETKVLSDMIVKSSDSPHDKIIKYMTWIDRNILVNKTDFYANPDNILKYKRGLCGDFSILSVAMLTTQNIPSHLISICGDYGHVAIEVYYNDTWHYYDPTFSAYWEQDGRVVSFDELKYGAARNATLHVGNMTRYNLYDGVPVYFTPEFYETYYPSGSVTKKCPLILNCTPCEDYADANYNKF